MTEKIGLIKNPLTIIAIFAGIAEVSGTVVLPFIAEQNQVLFIWFLIVFPTVLILSFFATLNFNNKVLYAPSDYRDEDNYLLSSKYNAATLSNMPVKESYDEVFLSFGKSIDDLRGRIDKLYEKEISDIGREVEPFVEVDVLAEKRSLYSYQVHGGFSNANNFVKKMSLLGYSVSLYSSYRSKEESDENMTLSNQAIWLGTSVDLNVAKEFILNAKKYFPFINYIGLTILGDTPRSVLSEVFVGGSTKSAIEIFNARPIDKAGFEKIDKAQTLSQLHQIIASYSDNVYEE